MMKGATLTHNHPLGTTLSPEYISLLVGQELKTIRATGKEKTYQLTRNKNIVNRDFENNYTEAYNANKSITDIDNKEVACFEANQQSICSNGQGFNNFSRVRKNQKV